MNENAQNPAPPNRAFAVLLAYTWWLVALRGAAAVVFGILAFVWPGMTLRILVYLFGAYAIVNGILELTQAFSSKERSGSLALQGIVSLLAGIIAFSMPQATRLALLMLIAAWAIVTGVFEIVDAVRLRKLIAHEWLLIVAGILSVVFGILLVLQPAASTLVLLLWVRSFAIVFGVLLLALAFRVRTWSRADHAV